MGVSLLRVIAGKSQLSAEILKDKHHCQVETEVEFHSEGTQMIRKERLASQASTMYFSTSVIDYGAFLSAANELCEHSEILLGPVSLLRQLLQCCDTDMLIDIAEDPKSCPEILFCLAQFQNVDLRFAMAENHNLDFNVLSLLAHDENPYVSVRAQHTIDRVKGIRINEAVIPMRILPQKSKQIC